MIIKTVIFRQKNKWDRKESVETSLYMKMYYIIEETLQTNVERMDFSAYIGMIGYSHENWVQS